MPDCIETPIMKIMMLFLRLTLRRTKGALTGGWRCVRVAALHNTVILILNRVSLNSRAMLYENSNKIPDRVRCK